MKLFSAIVLDVWKEKQAQNFALSACRRQYLNDLIQRKDQLDVTFIFKEAIDRQTHERQRDKINEEIVLAEMRERDAKLEGYDVEAVLNFAEYVILNAAWLWVEVSSDQKQRLQKGLFPRGVSFSDGVYQTAETCTCCSSC